MTPTYDQVIGWKPESLGDIASAARTLQSDLDGQAPKAGDPVINLTTAEWKGLARTAADGRAESITRWLRSLSDQYGTLAAALDNCKTAIRGAMTTLENQKSTAAALGYELRTDDPAYNVDFKKSIAPDGAEYDKGTATELQQALLDRGRAADTAVSDANSAVSAALGAIAGLTPASIAQNSSTIDPTKAAPDAQAILSGTATPEQRARFEQAARLTPEQLAKLRAGERIDVSPEQLEYLTRAAGAVDVGNGRLSGIAAFEAFGTRPGDEQLRAALANGLQLVSNNKVHAGDKQGGYALLPQSIKDVIVAGAMPLTSGTGLTEAQRLTLSRAGGIANLLSAGDPKYQAGTDLDRGLGKLAQNYTNMQARHEQELFGKGLTPEGFGDLQDVLRTVGNDKIYVHEAFVTDSDGADFIHDLMTVNFTDDAAAAGSFWHFTEDDARYLGGGIPGADAGVGDRADFATASRASDIVESVLRTMHSTEGYKGLTDIPGLSGDKSVGEVNPKALQILAETLKPYASELGGDQDSTLPGFNDPDPGSLSTKTYQNLLHSPDTSNFEGASRIFGLLATDEAAAKTFYSEVYSTIAEETAAYAADPNAGDAGHRLALMSHLRGLADEGLLYAAHDKAGDDYAAAKSAHELKGKILDDVFKATDLGTGKLTDKAPGSGILLDHLKDDLKKSLLGPAPVADGFDPEKYKLQLQGSSGETGGAVGDLRAAIFAATEGDVRSQLSTGVAAELEKKGYFEADGSLKSRDDILKSTSVSETELNTDVRTIVEQLAARTGNSNPDNIPEDYGDVWGESEELGSKWKLNLP